MPFAPRIAFVDVETTGTSPQSARVTEVGVVTVEATGPSDEELGAARVEEWSSLVNPGVPIPPEIRFLTGIDDAMVAAAPPFARIAPALLERLQGAVFVAHHVRFDYGFLKQEFARAGLAFQARTLCTVRLSRLLFPDRSPHSLDAIIARHGLPADDRHRALGDARVLWAFVRTLYRRYPRPQIEAAIRRLLRHPNLPAHLPPDTLERIPAAPGVYTFYGLNDHPLYIGKSADLRTRVASHFCGDYASERGVRLASETRRIDWTETAGEFGARLLEGRRIRDEMPAHNVVQRRRRGAVFVRIDPATARPLYLPAAGALAEGGACPEGGALSEGGARFEGHAVPEGGEPLFGPFASRAAARAALIAAAGASSLCLAAMGLERRRAGEPCFRRTLGKCLGACVGGEPAAALARRAGEALAPQRFPDWPFPGAVALVERDAHRVREDWHVFDRWAHLGTVHGEDAARALVLDETAARRRGSDFEPAVFTLLRDALRRLGSSATSSSLSLVEVEDNSLHVA